MKELRKRIAHLNELLNQVEAWADEVAEELF